MADLKTNDSTYPTDIDTYTAWANDTDDAVEGMANHPLSAIIKLENEIGIAGTGIPAPKGNLASLAARLASISDADGGVPNGTSFPTVPTPVDGQLFWRNDFTPPRLYVYDLTGAQWEQVSFDGDHGGLGGLADDDHTQYVHNTVARTVSAGHTFSGDNTFSGTNTHSGISDITKMRDIRKPIKTVTDDYTLTAQDHTVLVNSVSYEDKTTIAFVDGGGGNDSITDSANGFVTAGFEDGDDIVVTGATNAGNNVTVTAISVVAGTIEVATGTFTAETAGASVTLKERPTITPPTASTVAGSGYDKEYEVILSGSGQMIFSGTISGESNPEITTQYESMSFYTDGTDYYKSNHGLGSHIVNTYYSAGSSSPQTINFGGASVTSGDVIQVFVICGGTHNATITGFNVGQLSKSAGTSTGQWLNAVNTATFSMDVTSGTGYEIYASSVWIVTGDGTLTLSLSTGIATPGNMVIYGVFLKKQ